MMKSLLLFSVLSLFLTSQASAFTCNARDQAGQEVTISIDDKKVDVKLAENELLSLPVFSNVWDGHLSGFITGHGIAIKFQNHYGCIRNVVVTGLLQRDGRGHVTTLKFASCKGGSTPDTLCLRN